MQEISLSLRERNRMETWSAVHEAAAGLTLEAGLAAVTVDAISARAGVSKRTFFNYFPSKEDAIIGVRAPTIPADLLRAFRESGDDLLTRTVRLLAETLRVSAVADVSIERRRQLIRAHPELRSRILQHITAVEQLVDTVLSERLGDADSVAPIAQLPDRDGSPRALLMLAGTITRFAFSQNPGSTVDELGDNIESAIQTFREVVKTTL